MNSYAKRTHAYHTYFSLLAILSVLLGAIASPLAVLAAPLNGAVIPPQAAVASALESSAARPIDVAPAAPLEKPVEAPVQAPAAAPNLSPGQPAPTVLGSSSITLTKSVIGNTQNNYTVTIVGPSYPSGASLPIISGMQVITGLVNGVYTITEVSPGTGWTTIYTATTGYSTGSSAVVTLTNAITATTFTATQITGTVYADYNENGLYDRTSTFTETGVLSVTATLYNMTGTAVNTAQTDVNGRFTMTLSSPNNVGPFRVEFTNLPAGIEVSRIFTGTQNGSSVQFINSAAQATNLYFAVNSPCDYCQSAPTLATTTMVAGNQITNDNATTESSDTVVAFGYNSTTSTALPTGLAQAQQVGTTYGVAYQRGSKTTFVTAYMKRHAGFGPGGPGAIYAISAGPDGIAGTNDDVPSTFMTLDSPSYFGAGSFGSDPHPYTRTEGIANSPYYWFHDANSLDDVGKMSFGDIDISENDQELYTINLYNRSLYRIPIGKTPTAPAVGSITVISVPVSLPNTGANALAAGSGSNQHQTCPASDVRPFGLGMYHQLVYVGMVCSAQTANISTSLRAYVYAFDPAVNTFGTAPVLEFPLNYVRIGNFAQTWKPWMDTFSTIASSTASDGVASFTNYPQPMLSDIVFDKGQMILGLRDRAGDQLGKYAGDTSTSTAAPTAFYYLAASGDLLRACSTNDSTWAVENDGSCGGVTTAGTSSSNAGPGGGEYYLGDYAYYGQATPAHAESSQGSMAQVPGMTEVVMNAIDATALNSGGIEWLNNRTGTLADAYKVYQSTTPSGTPSSPTSSATPDTTFGKAGGIGDLEALCDPAPIEIGNRVWWDQDGDGVQDAGEPAMAGVVVTLTTPAGTITTTTNVSGTYVFTREAATGSYSTTLRSNTAYTLTINPNQAALSGYSLTAANQQVISGSSTSNDSILDTRDSDASLVGNLPTIYYTTGLAGQNNHGLDFGFTKPAMGTMQILNTYTPPGTIQVTKQVTTTDGAVQTVAGNFTINIDCNGATVSPSNSQTVVNGGSVTFSNIPAGASCTLSESTDPLPVPPSGYVWVAHQLLPNQVTVSSGVTSMVIARNTLAPLPTGSSVLTLTKAIFGTGTGPFTVTVSGPSGYLTTTTINGGQSKVITGLVSGLYTVTETSPGAGWTTTYTATTGYSTGSSAVVTLTNSITATRFTPTGPITGTVYNDYGSDGNLTANGTITDTGVQSVTVTVYDNLGNSTSTVSSASGRYTITPSFNGPYRVEFTNLPNGYEPSRVFTGTQNGTSVQFVNIAAGASGVNLGINDPGDYCQSNPNLATSCFISGDPADATGFQKAVTRFSNSANGDATVTPALATQIGSKAQVGAVWGQAYDGNKDQQYLAAMLKRHVGMGPGGPGAIYRITAANTAAPGAPTQFYDLTDYGISVGAIPDNTTRGVNVLHSAPSTDAAVFPMIGKAGLGDLEVTPDGSTLYVVNLFDRTIYKINTATPTVAPTALPALPNPGCTNGVARPWALKYYHGLLYAGVTCTAESPGGTNADLSAYIYTYNGSVWSSAIVNVPLTYTKGSVIGSCSSAWKCRFNHWLDTETTEASTTNPPTAIPVGASGSFGWGYPQPLLGDIEIDNDGSLILGIMDRTGHQYAPNNNNTSGVLIGYGITGGDIRRVCNTGTLANPVYTIEGGVGCTQAQTNPQTGGSEFYDDNATDVNDFHEEIHVGGLALLPGSNRVSEAVMDATRTGVADIVTDGGGVQWLSNQNGALLQGLTLFVGTDAAGLYGKGAGIGDIELLCNAAPIEIGNRVWWDQDGDGVQDAGEPGMAGVQVSLQTISGTVNTTTDINGNYTFTREAASGAYSTTLRPNTNYTITINSIPSGYGLTTPNAQALAGASVSSNHAISDVRDSDAVLVGGVPTLYYTTGSAGQNNHGLDFGFAQSASGQVTILNTAPVVVPNPGGFSIHKVIATTDGSNPTVTGNFNVLVNCPGNTGYSTTLSLNANGAVITQGNLVSGTVCSFSENTLSLPAAPNGYTWVNARINPASITIQSDLTATVQALNTLAPLPPLPSNVLTLTKTISGTGSGPFTVTVSGPSGYLTTTTINGGQTKVISGLASGSYTVTETSPSAGWTKTYTATTGYSTGSSAVVTVQNVSSVTGFLPLPNVAVGKSATQSSDLVAATAANLAVDGNTDGNMSNGSVAIAGYTTNGWWQLDLGASYPISTVVLWSRTDGGLSQTSDLRVFVSDTPFTSQGYNATLSQVGVSNYRLGTAVAGSNPISVNRSGRYVRVQLEGTDYLSLAEVQVFAQVVSGIVFEDFNSDGQMSQGTSNDVGVSGVNVTVYGQTGNVVANATTDASGFYIIPMSVAGPYRVEFTNLPSGYEPSRVYTGTQNGTSVQFVNTSAQAAGVNLGIVVPNDYSQDNPLLVVPSHTNGNGINNTNAGLVAFPYDGSGTKTTVLQESEIGAAWGEGYQRTPGRLFVASFMRRQVGFKDGPGYVYVLNRNGNSLSLASSFNLQGVVPANGGPAIDLGSVCRRDNTDGDPDNNCLPLSGVAADYTLAIFGLPSVDLDAYAKVGKMSYGDIDVSEDGQTLWLTNLYQNALIRVDISASNFTSGVKQYPLSGISGLPTCADFNSNGSATPTGDLHPFALKFYGGKGYLGVTCDAFNSRDNGDLRAFVLSFDPANPSAGFTPVLTVPLNYLLHNTTVIKPHWLPWSSTWAQSVNNPDGNGSGFAPEPVLSDIEFSEDGSIIVGLMDRHALQQFGDNYPAISQAATLVGVFDLGDILKFCHVAGSYVMEGTAASCPVAPKGIGLTSDGISGNGEYFVEARADFFYEAFMGALALLPGSTDVVGTFVDPGTDNSGYYSGGTAWWKTTTPGSNTRTYRIYPPAATGQPADGYANKGNGLGDIELLIDPAPLEIGNRVWDDIDGDGVQDAGEPGLSGVQVTLQTPSGSINTTTDINGSYYFTREATTGAYSTTLRPNTNYTITINSIPSGYSLTTPNAQALAGASVSSNHAISDVRDSDAVLVGGVPTIYYTTGSAGQNNHGLDFGFTKPANGQVDILNIAPAVTVQRFGDRLWLESDNDGIATTNFIAPVANKVITATDQNGTVYTTLTDNDGYYTFTVPAGTYTVTYGLPPAGYQPSSTHGGSVDASSSGNDTSHTNSTVVRLDPNETITTVDFGFGPLSIGTLIVRKNNVPILNCTQIITGGSGSSCAEVSHITGTGTQTFTFSDNLATPNGIVSPTFTLALGEIITFNNVISGVYAITESLPAGWVQESASCSNGSTLSTLNVSTDITVTCLITNVQQFADLQIVKLVSGGSVSDPFTVTVTGPNNYNLTTTVTSSAARVITNLVPGIYTVTEQSASLPTPPIGYTWTTALYTPTNGSIDLIPGTTGVLTVTNPLTPTVQRFGDRLWLESDNDGNAATNFVGPVANKVVTATAANGTVYTTLTDNNGTYTFTVPAGTYTVTYGLPPAGYQPSSTPGGSVVNAASGGNDTSHNDSTVVMLNPGETITTVDFGFNPIPVQFGDRVWIESDTDGLAATGTITPVQGMTISATDGISTFVATTDADGYYSFTLPAGVYTVTYSSVPSSYGAVVPSTVVSGSTASGNAGSYQQPGNPDANHGQNTVVTLNAGQANWTVDFAFWQPVPTVDVVKYTNGVDADLPSGPILPVGQTVTWTYDISNTGNVTLTNITLADDKQGGVLCPSSDLPPHTGMTCVLTGTTTAGQYVNTAIVTGTPTLGPNTPVTDTNPSHYYGGNPGLVLRKYTNGYDADSLPLACNTPGGQPCVTVGSTVTWTYVVTNTGNLTLTQVELSDDREGVISCPTIATLAPNETKTCIQTGIATAGQYTNTGIVTGTPSLPPGVPLIPDLPNFPPAPPITSPVTSTNPSHYTTLPQFGDRVWIESDTDGLAATGTITPVQGMTITATDGISTFVATTDADGYYSFTLPAGTYTVTYGSVPSNYGAVTASTVVSGTSESGNAGSYQQPGNPDANHGQNTVVTLSNGESNWQVDFAFWQPVPTVDVVKYTNGVDADLPSGPILPVGQTVTWTYDISNTGNVTLTNITLADNVEGSVSCPSSDLPPHTGMTCVLTGTTTAGQYGNTAIVTGTPTAGPTTPVTDTNPSHYFGGNPGLVLRKYTNGYDADGLTGPYVATGGTVTWTYVVTNTGNQTLSNVTLIDDQLSAQNPLTTGVTLLAGQSITVTKSGMAVAGQYTNTGTVTGTTPGNTVLTFTNPSHYFGVQPDIALTKYTNGYDADTIPGPTINQGKPVTWTYLVTNTGNVALTAINLGDDKEGTLTCPATDLAVGDSMTCTWNGVAGIGQYTNTAIVTGTPNIPTNPTPDLPNVPTEPTPNQPVTDTNPSHYYGQPNVLIGDHLWIEDDTDGAATTGSVTPVVGQVVTATSSTGVVYTDTTDSNGLYTITVPANDTYTVTTGTPTGTVPSLFSGTPGNDQSHTPSGTVVPVTTTNNLTIDFGFHTPNVQFGDRVWIESDTDGWASTGTITPVQGMTISATDGISTFVATTDADGYYSFTLPAGTYTVTYGSVPSSYGAVVPSTVVSGSTVSDNAGNYQQAGNPDANHAQNTVVTLNAGQANWLIDFAFWQPRPTVDVIKYTNGEDADAAPGPNIVVGDVVTWSYDITNTGNVTLTNITLSDDQEGGVTCPNNDLAPGATMSCVMTGTATLGQYANTAIVTGTPTAGPSTPVTDTNPSHYRGVLVSLGNRLWFDTNNNGSADAGEQNIANVAVELYQDSNGDGVYSAGDSLISSTLSNASGYYTFTNLRPSSSDTTRYLVVISDTNFLPGALLAGYRSSTATTVSSNNAADNNSDHGSEIGSYGASGFVVASSPVSLTVGNQPTAEGNEGNDPIQTSADADSNQTLDFGFYKLEIGNRVWVDSDRDGIYDGGEPPVAGLLVTGTNLSTGEIYTTTTDASGVYTLTGITPGNYQVQIVTPTSLMSTAPDSGNVIAADGDDDGPGGSSGTLTTDIFPLTPGVVITGVQTINNLLGTTVNTSIDFGLTLPADWGDLPADYPTMGVNDGPYHEIIPGLYLGASVDAEGNGQPDNDAQGDDAGPAPDDEDGVQFPPLLRNQPAAIKVTAVNTGSTDAVIYGFIDWNGDFDFSDAGEIVSVTVPAATNSPTVFTLNYSVPLTAPLNSALGARFRLSTDVISASQPVGRASSGEVEDYIIHIAPTQPDVEVQKYTNGYDADSGTGPILLAGNPVTWTYVLRNAGNITLTNVTLSDDKLGAITSCEAGVTLPITMSVGQIVTCTMTGIASGGQYSNTAVVTGTDITSPTHKITDTNPSRYYGMTSGLQMVKYTNGYDADAYPNVNAPSGSQSQAPTLTVGASVVWSYVITNTGDTPLNPVLLVDDQEGGISCPVNTLAAGATMICTKPGVASVNGVYTNTAVVTGTPTLPPQGPPDLPNFPLPPTSTVPLTDSNPSHYLGFLLNLGNQVWYDTNNNGKLDSSEVGIAGVTVELYQDTDLDGLYTAGVDQYVATTSTIAGGTYTFTELLPGDYVVVITGTNFAPGGVLADYRSSSDIATSGDPDNNVDNDDNGLEDATGTTVNYVASSAVTLSAGDEPDVKDIPGDSNWSVDFGFYKLILGNQVWEDRNLNGFNDGNEPLLSGITVNLVESGSGNVISTTTTDANGLYTFTGMTAGQYQVVIVPPSGYGATTIINVGQSIAADDDSDGQPTAGNIASAIFNLTPGVTIQDVQSVDNATATTVNPSVDFGLIQAMDWGDLPPGYNTVAVEGGAYHFITSTLTIGAVEDAEMNGQPSGSATGDDINGTPDDEDGVSLPATSQLIQGKSITVPVIVSNNTGSAATLYGFIDWNGDDDFSDAGEVVTATVSDGTTSGTTTLAFVIPSDANTSELLGARFRLSTDSTLGPDGIAADGEVEDYFIQITAAGPAIDVTKYTNGYDADEVTGPALATGSTVTWTYVVRNAGNVPLTATVSDDLLGAVTSCNGTTLPAVLQAGQVVTCTMSGSAITGQYSNTAIVTGTSVFSPTKVVTDDNPSHYFGADPSIVVTKWTNGYDADAAIDAMDTIAVGDTVTWTYRITNTGNVVLNNLNLVDDIEGTISCPVNSLQPGQSVLCTFVGTATATSLYTNTAIVTGTPTLPPMTPPDLPNFPPLPPSLTPVTDTNPSHYTGVPLNLGNQVWYDANNNGKLDNGEQGVTGVAVELYRDSNNDGVYTPGVDTLITNTTTIAGGWYTFTDLLPGDYVVVLPGTNFTAGGALAAYRSSSDIGTSANPNNNINGDDNGIENATGLTVNYVASNAISLNGGDEPDTTTETGDSNWSVDFGFYKLVLGNQVWEDLNLNGVRDGNEPVIPGVTVNLVEPGSGNVISTTTTDANGVYTFTGITTGQYQVVVVPPNGYGASVVPNPNQPIGSDNDNDGTPSNGSVASPVFNLTPGVNISGVQTTTVATGTTVNPSVDFGLIRAMDWGDLPADYNTLLADNGAYHIITSTLGIGANLDAESNGQPSGSATGDDVNGTPDDEDGVTLPATSQLIQGKSITVPVVVSNNTGSSAVLYGFIDWNGDDDFSDAGEVVTATVANGTTSGTTALTFVIPSNANTSELLGARFRLSTDSTIGPDGIAPDGEVEDYLIQVTAAGPAIDVTKYTNGYDADASASSATPAGPMLATGSTVTWTYVVRNAGNVPLTTTLSDDLLGAVTSCNGTTLPAVLSAGQVVTCTLSGSAISGQYSNTAIVTGTSVFSPTKVVTDDNPSHYFGADPSIIVTKWTNGYDADAATDAMDTIAVGDSVTWTYRITNTGNVVLNNLNLVDDVEGTISCPVNSLQPGQSVLCTYVGEATATSLYTNTAIVTGTPTLPPMTPPDLPNFPPVPPTLSPVTDTNPSHYTGVPLNLGNQVWYDANNNGKLDAGEQGVTGVAVELLADTNNDGIYTPGVDTIVSNTTTVAGGWYTFTNLLPGDYVVVLPGTNFTTGGVLADYRSSSDIGTSANPNNNINSDDNGIENATGLTVNYVASNAINLNGGDEPDTTTEARDSNWSVDFGFYKLVLGNQVWEDLNLNGVKDSNEPIIPGVTVNLVEPGSGNVISTTTTDANGLYTFTGITTGQYQVVVVPPNGYGASVVPNPNQPIGADNDNDGTPSNGTVASPVFNLTSGVNISGVQTTTVATGTTVNPSIDFGLIRAMDWGDLPADYNTLLADGGAYHIITDTLQIGANLDAESNGQPSGSATGDDVNGTPDDEDGVTLPATSQLIQGKSITVPVVVSNNTGSSAVLYGFIDWNGDDDFSDAGEVVTATVANGTTNGTTVLTYVIPSNANTSELLGVRVRLSTDSTLGPDGIALDGEVEDYLIQVTAAGPAIDVTKYTNGYDADASASSATAAGPTLATGSTVTWTYVVRNAGNVPLTTTVSDDLLGAVTSCNGTTLPAVLQAGQVVTCTLSGSAISGQYSNTAIVTGTSVFSPTKVVTDDNPSHYFGADPSIVVTKWTNGYDADAATDAMDTIAVGDTVTWTYRITNTGNVVLSNITLNDDIEGTITCPVSSLAPGASTLCTFVGTSTATSLYTNMAIVTGTPTLPPMTPPDLPNFRQYRKACRR